MQLAEILVGRDEQQHSQALAEESIDGVEEAGQPLPGSILGVRREQLAGVLDDEQAPLVRLRLFLIAAQEH
ncbi:hypothetical protein BH24CHL6_BH24CHL6_10450 [soil metagenome]